MLLSFIPHSTGMPYTSAMWAVCLFYLHDIHSLARFNTEFSAKVTHFIPDFCDRVTHFMGDFGCKVNIFSLISKENKDFYAKNILLC